jgi:hypothetical protein
MICKIPVTWGDINPVQVLSYGFLAVTTLHGIHLDSPHLNMAHQRSQGTVTLCQAHPCHGWSDFGVMQ